TCAVIIIVLSIIAYMYPPNIFDSWSPYLFVTLIGLVVVELLDIIFSNGNSMRNKIYGWITVILFSGYMLYDTNILRQNAKIIITKINNNKNNNNNNK